MNYFYTCEVEEFKDFYYCNGEDKNVIQQRERKRESCRIKKFVISKLKEKKEKKRNHNNFDNNIIIFLKKYSFKKDIVI